MYVCMYVCGEQTALLHPISFSISEEFIARRVPFKDRPLCRAVPGNLSTYLKVSGAYLICVDLPCSDLF